MSVNCIFEFDIERIGSERGTSMVIVVMIIALDHVVVATANHDDGGLVPNTIR